jgi:hypothetical protein
MAFSNAHSDKLYGLLPAYIRERDAAEGEPLRALLRIGDQQTDAIEADILQLLADIFIETCEPWVVPYIGDLVGTTPLFDESQVKDGDTAQEIFADLEGPRLRPSLTLRGRVDVAKTIYFRRRKGTLPMLEELARDVTGWSAHAVAFFELLRWTQWLRNHLRPHAAGTADLRVIERVDRLNGAFDELQHTVDLRPMSQTDGWYNIKNIGFFLWRLRAHGLHAVRARRLGAAGDFRFHFSPLGNSAPLFSRSRPEGDEAGLATELHVPQPIRPARWFADLQAYAAMPLPRPGFTSFYGLFDALPGFNVAPAPSLMVFVAGVPVPAENVRCRNLSVWSQPKNSQIGIDVTLGRLVLGPDLPAGPVDVYYFRGFPADLGGGPYARRAWLMKTALAQDVLIVNGSGAAGTFATINAALAQWIADGGPNTIIRIGDNRTYAETLALDMAPASGVFLAIEAADGCRPHLRLGAALTVKGDRSDFTLTFGGCLIEGRIDIQGSLRALRLIHATLVPGVKIAEADPLLPPPPPLVIAPSISAAAVDAAGALANLHLRVELAFSIVGPIRLPDHAEALIALDTIIDGVGTAAVAGVGAPDAAGPPIRFERVTVRGAVTVRQIDLATEVIFDGLLSAQRKQVGCVRFCWVDALSRTPRRYRCQPDLAERVALTQAEATSGPLTPAAISAIRENVRRRVRPEYAAESYGMPAYLQLSLRGPIEIATGAEDGSEMGAYCHLKQPQREANLKTRLEEYLPFGLDSGAIYVT